MSALAKTVKPKSKPKSNDRKTTSAPLLEPNRNYSVADAAAAAGVAAVTLWRAIDSQNLKTYRIGRRRIISGQQIKDWLEAGGKTSGRRLNDQ